MWFVYSLNNILRLNKWGNVPLAKLAQTSAIWLAASGIEMQFGCLDLLTAITNFKIFLWLFAKLGEYTMLAKRNNCINVDLCLSLV